MEIVKTNILEARIREVKSQNLIDIILRMASDSENCNVYIEFSHEKFLSVELSNFSEHISFEKFIEIIKQCVEKSSDLNEIFILVINVLSTYNYCSRIKINCNNLIDKINLKDIIKNYSLCDISFNNCEIVGVGNVIRYTESLFTAFFDRGSGELLKVTQPNASNPRPVIEFEKDIDVVKHLIFSGQGDDDYVNK